jgi:glycosyltransferase involved in cell wall biosynthesis
MRILFTTPSYDPYIGGAESVIQDLARELSRRGHTVTVVTAKPRADLQVSDAGDGIEVIRLDYLPRTVGTWEHAVRLIPSSVSMLWKLCGIIRSRAIDAICIGLISSRDGLFILLLSYLLRSKLIVYLHGGEMRTQVKVSRLLRWTLKRCLRTCHAAIAVSDHIKQEAVRFIPEVANKVWMISNGVDFKQIQSQPRYDYPREYILYVGRLHSEKGVDTLITAFHQVSDSIPHVDLLIAGRGPERERLENMVSEFGLEQRVKFLGTQSRPEVYSLLRGCRFLVLPSHAEGCPVTVLEAIAAGKMTIGSRVEGIVEVIESEVNGVFFAARDADELGSLILKYCGDETERLRIEANIKGRSWEKYDIATLVEKHLRLFQ